jgi:hypothetical protein
MYQEQATSDYNEKEIKIASKMGISTKVLQLPELPNFRKSFSVSSSGTGPRPDTDRRPVSDCPGETVFRISFRFRELRSRPRIFRLVAKCER